MCIVELESAVILFWCACVSKVEDLDQLNIIHVTGTKGKVS